MIGTERFAAALGASVLLHAAALASLEQLPRGWQTKEPAAAAPSPVALRASLRAAGASAEPGASLPPPPAFAQKTRERRTPPALPGVVTPHAYYPTHLLDERPQVHVHVQPAFPPDAPDSGRVVLNLFIGTDGRVEEIAVTESEPYGIFEQAAAQAFARAFFTPGRIRGEAVKSLMAVEVLFGMPHPLQ